MELHQLPKYRVLPRIHTFTRCAGIPCRTQAWSPWQSAQTLEPSGEFSGRSIFFTDGSASPPEYASVRISTWSVVHATPNTSAFHKGLARLTPGLVRTIARAETYAVLQAIKLSPACDLYVDNQGVCLNMLRINQSGYQPLEWKNQVNGDLWVEISQVIASKPPGAIRIFKVKSHRAPHEAKDPMDLWTILGHDCADKVAKEEMASQIHLNQWSTTRHKEYDQHIRDAILCSEYLYEVSKMVFKERKPIERGVPQPGEAEDETMEVEIRYVSLPIELTDPPHSNAWDPKWLQLVVHYFRLLTWPDSAQQPQVPPKPTELLELMLECFISSQILPPVNFRLQKQWQTAHQKVDWSKFHTQYFLFPRAENNILSRPYLTIAPYIWIRTLDFLKPHFHLFPGVRFPSNTLKTFGFGNNVTSISNRPRLLCGHLVSQLLHNTLVHGGDRLRYPLVLPVAEPRPLPSSFPPNF